MKKMLDEIIKNKNDQNQHVNKLLVIQILDVLNYLHSNNTLHTGIKLKNLLIYGIARLYDFELVSDVSVLRSYKSSIQNQQNSTKAKFGYEVEKIFSRIQAHLYMLRLTILEFDNIDILQRQFVQYEDLTENLNTVYDIYAVLDKGLKYDKSDLQNIAYKSKSSSILNIFKNHNILKNISQCQQSKLKNILKSQQKTNVRKYLQNINTDFNYLKMKLLGGSEKQQKQDFDNHIINKKDQNNDQKKRKKITQQIQFTQNQNEDISQIQVGVQNNINIKSLNQSQKNVKNKANSGKMIIDEQNYQTIHKKRKSQKIICNQNLNEDKSQNQVEEEMSIKQQQLSEINENEQYQENSDKKIIEEQDSQILNILNQSNQQQFNQNDDKNQDRMEIELNSSFYQQLFTYIQMIIDLYNSKQAEKKDLQKAQAVNQIYQRDYQIQKNQSEEPQENFTQNQKHQNINQKIQLHDLITKTNNAGSLYDQWWRSRYICQFRIISSFQSYQNK
ncbi:hypothetical protein ABPG73_016985 [Tetrahymena malaccensis]